MVTFISPQHGLEKAPLAAKLAGWPALHDLTPGSDFLEAVNSAPLPANVAFTSIYSCTDEFIQPYETSIIPGATNIGLCDGFVGHYSFFWDPEIYLVMHTALTQPAPAADPSAGSVDPPDPSLPAADDAGGCAVRGGSTGSGLALVLGAVVAIARRRRQSPRP